MINLKLAKQLEARAMRQLRELERTLTMAKRAGIDVRRDVSDLSNIMEGARPITRFSVRLSVSPREAEMPEETNWPLGFTFAWREGRGDGRLQFSKELRTPEDSRRFADFRLVDVRLNCLEDLPDYE